MTAGQHKRGQQRHSGTARLQPSRPLIGHPAVAPILGLWGAMLAGLVVLVLPARMVETALQGTGLAPLGAQAQFVIAGGAAVVLGGVLFAAAYAASLKANQHDHDDDAAAEDAADEPAGQQIRPLDPAQDLGSVSFDEPVGPVSFASHRAAPWNDDDDEYAPDLMPPPVALDLAEFAELPGRNAVWVETTMEAPVAEAPAARAPLAASAAPPPAPGPGPSAAALALLRAVAPEELSTVQMVERFAGALKEHRVASPASAANNRAAATREAALAEALKALAALSGTDAGAAQTAPLRGAIEMLQGRRGAA